MILWPSYSPCEVYSNTNQCPPQLPAFQDGSSLKKNATALKHSFTFTIPYFSILFSRSLKNTFKTFLVNNLAPYYFPHTLIEFVANYSNSESRSICNPLEILLEWYFFPVFQILRTVPIFMHKSYIVVMDSW